MISAETGEIQIIKKYCNDLDQIENSGKKPLYALKPEKLAWRAH
jgi:hypothetical protein